MPSVVPTRFVRLPDLCKYLGISREQGRALIASGALKAHHLPRHYSDERVPATSRRRWFIAEDDLADFLRRFRGDGRIPAELPLRSG